MNDKTPESTARSMWRGPAAIPALATALLGAIAIVLTLRAQPALEPPAAGQASAPSTPAKGVRLHGVAEPVARQPGTLRLATYNVENLFDDFDDPALSGRYDDKEMTKPEAHRRAAAEAIRRIDADVLALQEIESERALRWFRDQFLTGMGYDHVVSLDAGDERGIEQAVLSRFALKDPAQWLHEDLGGVHPPTFGREANQFAGQPLKAHRSPLRVTVVAPAEDQHGKPLGDGRSYEVTLLVVHCKSGGGGGYWREAEARAIARHVAAAQAARPDANVIVLGDFNAQLSEAPLKVLTGAGLRDAFDDRTARDPAIQTHSSGRVIDHILINGPAWRELILESRFVLGTPTRPAGVDWRATPAPEGWAADHYPVVIDLWREDRP